MVLGKDHVVVLDSDFPPSCSARLNSRRARSLRDTDGGHRRFHRSRVSSACRSDGKAISIWAFPGHVLTCMLELRTDVQNGTASSVVQKRTAENLEITKNVVQCTSRKGGVRRLGSLLT